MLQLTLWVFDQLAITREPSALGLVTTSSPGWDFYEYFKVILSKEESIVYSNDSCQENNKKLINSPIVTSAYTTNCWSSSDTFDSQIIYIKTHLNS